MVFLILAWVRVYHSKRIWHFFRAFLSKLYVGLLLREKDSLTKDASIVLNGLFIIVSSLLLYQLCIEYSWNFLPGSNFYLFMMIFFISLSFYILKTGVLKIFGAILNEKEKSSEYVFTITILNSVLGLLLLPVLVCSTYLNFAHSFLMAVGISLWVIIYIYRLYRGLSIGLRIAKVSQYYIFLYLCTLEILPMVILTRLFLSEL